MFDLTDKVALVTGGSRGLGRAIALALARQGADVGVNYRDNAEAAAEVVSEIRAMGRAAIAIKGDTSAGRESCEAIVKAALDEFGKIDVLVNNAGITRDGLILRMSKDSWDKVIATDLTGVFLCAQEAAKIMLKKRVAGRIVNITSVVGLMGNPGQTNYAAAKAGVVGFTKALAREIGSRGITVNAVAPGYVETPMTDVLNEEQKKALVGQIVLGRLGTADREELGDLLADAWRLAAPRRLAAAVTGPPSDGIA